MDMALWKTPYNKISVIQRAVKKQRKTKKKRKERESQ